MLFRNGEGAPEIPEERSRSRGDRGPSSPPPSSRNSDDGSVFSQPTTKSRQLAETEADIRAFVRGTNTDSVIVDNELQLNQQRKTCHQYLDLNGKALLREEMAKVEGEGKLTPEQWLSLSSWWLLKVPYLSSSGLAT